MHFRKPYVCSHKLDVQEANFCFTTLQNLRLFLWMQVYAWKEFPLLISGFGSLKCCTLLFQTNLKKSEENVQGNLLRVTPSRKHTNNQVKTLIQDNNLEKCNVDDVSSKVKSSQLCAMLFIFEHSEAVIKRIIKSRSPTMRHVSRTHRVALIDLTESTWNTEKGQFHT